MQTISFTHYIETYSNFYRRCKLEHEEAPIKSGMEKLCDALKVGLTLIGGCPKMGCSTFAVALAKGGVGGLNEEIRLLYDLPFARIKDINYGKEEKTDEAKNMKIEVTMSKGETIKEEDLPF